MGEGRVEVFEKDCLNRVFRCFIVLVGSNPFCCLSFWSNLLLEPRKLLLLFVGQTKHIVPTFKGTNLLFSGPFLFSVVVYRSSAEVFCRGLLPEGTALRVGTRWSTLAATPRAPHRPPVPLSYLLTTPDICTSCILNQPKNGILLSTAFGWKTDDHDFANPKCPAEFSSG